MGVPEDLAKGDWQRSHGL